MYASNYFNHMLNIKVLYNSLLTRFIYMKIITPRLRTPIGASLC